MKLEPLEAFIGDDPCVSYIGIRADERRNGYISHKPNICAAYPFIDDGIVKTDVLRILEESVGIPEYYKWRSRSGCYFCFFQRKEEWVGLAENHPELFEKAKQYEKTDETTGKQFTWVRGMTLSDISKKGQVNLKEENSSSGKEVKSWQAQMLEDTDDETCLICTL